MNVAAQPKESTVTEIGPLKPDAFAFEQIVAELSDGVLLLDARGTDLPIVYANAAYQDATGYVARELLGNAWQALSRRGESAVQTLRGAMARREAVECELADKCKDGSVRHSHVRLSPVRDASGDVRYFLVMQRDAADPELPAAAGGARRDVGGSKPKVDTLNRLDPVTGLLRYELFLETLNRDLAMARRERRQIVVMVYDIVELDVYRQTFGAKAAESCVRMIAAQISGAMRRASDLCARFDDALIAASAIGQDAAEAEALVARIVANIGELRLHNPRASSGRYVGVVTATVAGVPGPGDNAEMFLARARSKLPAKIQAAGPAPSATSGSGSNGSTLTSTPKYGWSK